MASVKSTIKSAELTKPKAPQSTEKGPGRAVPVESLESAILTVLKTAQQQRQVPQCTVRERTVRIRGRGETDRRFLLAYEIDPEDSETVIFRVRPLSDRELGPSRPLMLTTQQAAEQLNVSRPYIVKLVDEGAFEGVERTQAGHRRIPAAEVERVRNSMQTSRRAALNRMDELTSDLCTKELDAARIASKRRQTKNA